MTRDEAKRFIESFVKLRELATDEMSLEVPNLYPTWKSETAYITGQRVLYNDTLYRVLQDHISQESWTPTDSPSLFAKVLIPDDDVIPEWEQPNSTNPYMTGDKVSHNGQTWESTVDNNVWEPGVYGWTQI
jgi:hypothetical protein